MMHDNFATRHIQPEQITTARCILRKLNANDLDAIQSFAADSEVTRFMDWGPNEPAQTIEFLERVTAPGESGWTFGVTDRETGRLFGTAGINVAGDRRAEIGYCLAKAAWGRGFGTEVAKALIDLGFGTLGLHRIQARCDPMNFASARVLEKCGMQFEGHLRECVFVRGEWKDRRLFAVLESDQDQAGEEIK